MGISVCTPEHRLKISKARKGFKMSEEQKKKISLGMVGNNNTEGKTWRVSYVKQGYSTTLKGRKWSFKRRLACLMSGNNGKPRKLRLHKSGYCSRGKEYHPDWHKIRKSIYQRDNWTCQECSVKCHNSVKIQCHHIDYDTKNNQPLNLITLCASCHMKTKFKRDNWVEYYSNKMKVSKN